MSVKISELATAAKPLSGRETVVMNQNGLTVTSPLSDIASYVGGTSNLPTLSSNWQNTYTTVGASSANWQNTYTTVAGSSGNWQDTYTSFLPSPNEWLETNLEQTLIFSDPTLIFNDDGTFNNQIYGDIPANSYKTAEGSYSIVFGRGVSEIGESAFDSEVYTTEQKYIINPLHIPGTVKRIGYAAFAFTPVPGLTLYEGLTSIEAYAFTSSLTLGPTDGVLIIPNSVVEIGDNAFGGSNTESTLKLSENLKVINPQTFSNSTFTGDLIIPNSVVEIGEYAFQSNFYLNSLTLSNNLTSIGLAAFNECFAMFGPLIIPNSVVEMGPTTFSSTNFDSVSISTGLKRIDDDTFSQMPSLTNITIPNNITSIGNNAFKYNYALSSVTLSNNLTSIGAYVFDNCSFPKLIIPQSLQSLNCIDEGFLQYSTTTELECYAPLSAFSTNALNYSSITSISARASDTSWTVGPDQDIKGATGVTVIKNLI
jgi:hypothetical protein